MRPAPDRSLEPAGPAAAGRKGEALLAAAFVLLIAAGLLVNLGVRPLEFEEPRRALVALEMALRGNLLVPTTNGALYLNKPPLFNWLLIACTRLTGSHAEWVLRLPTVASMLGMALAFWWVARRRLGRSTALTATAFLLTFPTLLFYGTLYGEIDVFYALLVVLQGLAVFAFEQADRPVAMFVWSYLFTALGFLTKGVPSLAFQALTLAGWLMVVRRPRWLLSWAHLAGIATFALCAGGYFAAYARYADPLPFLAKLLFEGADKTAAGPSGGAVRLALQLVGFPFQLAWLCFPWVAFAPGFLAREARARVRSTPFLAFCATFVAANVAPYWISPGNKPRYMFPFLPFLAALLAVAHEHLAERGVYGRVLRWVAGVALALAPLAVAVVPFTPWGRSVSSLWLWGAVAALLGVLAVRFWRAAPGWPRLALALLAIAAARIGYDLLVPQFRREHSENPFFERVASVLNTEFRDQPVLLVGKERLVVHTIPVVGRSFTYSEPEWFSFSLSFHYTRGRNEPLRYAETLEPGKLYLAHTAFPVTAPHEVIRVFDFPVGDDKDLKLFRVLQ